MIFIKQSFKIENLPVGNLPFDLKSNTHKKIPYFNTLEPRTKILKKTTKYKHRKILKVFQGFFLHKCKSLELVCKNFCRTEALKVRLYSLF